MTHYDLTFFEHAHHENFFKGRVEFETPPNTKNRVSDTKGSLTIIRGDEEERCKLNGTNWWPPTSQQGTSDLGNYAVTLEGMDQDIPYAYLSLMPSFEKVTVGGTQSRWGIAGEAKIKMDAKSPEKLYLVIGEAVA